MNYDEASCGKNPNTSSREEAVGLTGKGLRFDCCIMFWVKYLSGMCSPLNKLPIESKVIFGLQV
jgi:hypothetical protein